MKTKNNRYALPLLVILLTISSTHLAAEDAATDAGVEKETVFTLIQKGGPIMIPLGIASLLALALGFERLISQSKERVLPGSFIEGLKKSWKEDSSGKQALSYCDQSGGTVGPIFKAAIRRAKMGRDAVEKAMDDAGSREADRMKRSLRPLKNIATVAPLLGLLGTVYGMIDAFQKTSQMGGTASTAMLATGIYEALVTTATGLTIAIPVLLFYNFLTGRVDRLIDSIDEAGAEFLFSFEGGDDTSPDPEKNDSQSQTPEED